MRPGPGPDELGGDQVEGHHAVHELLVAARRPVKVLWVAEGMAGHEPVASIVAVARRRQVPVHVKSPEALAAAARTSAPQGVIAWAQSLGAVALSELLAPLDASPAPFLLVLDGVTDPGNFGALLRTAACAGATGVIVARHRSAPLTPAALKSAAGAVERMPIALVPGIPAALQQLSKRGLWVVGLDPLGDADLWRVGVLDEPVAIVLGSEGGGLSQLARKRCDVVARIPQGGPLGSLNVAAAGAVACFEVARRRDGGTGGR